MASPDWFEIYRTYTGEELEAERILLRKQITDAAGITGQAAGNVSYQRDLQHLQQRLHAVTRVQTEKSQSGLSPSQAGYHGRANFSNVRV